jgi:uncharacterized protein YndB with AHSA1/START domain
MAMATSQTAKVTLPTDEQIQVVREFDAPARLVYETWTRTEHVSRWWHSGRGEMTVCEIDLRVGGAWRWVMVTPDGREVGFHGEYRELVEGERIVFTEVFEGVPDDGSGGSVNTLTLQESGGRTTMTLVSEYPSAEIRDFVLSTGMEVGMQDAFDRLERIAIELS